ncbi:MAG: hypothetical protein LUD15_06820, partial [Bacteroides sp.]|nr:hypothetical protein [Bacteroides sp.]
LQQSNKKMTTKSHYKLSSLLFMIWMVTILGITCGFLLVKALFNKDLTGHVLTARILSVCVFILELLYIWLFMTECKRIEASEKEITFINPVFPFIRKTVSWSTFDYYIIITDSNGYGIYDTIWLIKDKRLKSRISGYSVKNLPEIIAAIRLPYKGHPKIKDSKNFSCRFLSAEVPEIFPTDLS